MTPRQMPDSLSQNPDRPFRNSPVLEWRGIRSVIQVSSRDGDSRSLRNSAAERQSPICSTSRVLDSSNSAILLPRSSADCRPRSNSARSRLCFSTMWPSSTPIPHVRVRRFAAAALRLSAARSGPAPPARPWPIRRPRGLPGVARPPAASCEPVLPARPWLLRGPFGFVPPPCCASSRLCFSSHCLRR